jgi:hypothetical protein
LEAAMSFSPEWLALREPADIRARNAEVLQRVAHYCSGIERPRIVDLAAGTGSTYRAMAAHLPPGQVWRLCDYDAGLLAEAKKLLPEAAIETMQVDLFKDLGMALDPRPDLVVTSAFLDLVSGDWLDRLIAELAARKLPFYAALSYDGRAACDPPHRGDKAVIEGVNRHQKTDKGFGPALGPDAAVEAATRLRAAGFAVAEGRSDWQFTQQEGLVQSMIIDGWAQAAYEIEAVEDELLSDWAGFHMTRIADGNARIMVGHIDLFAVPA